MFISVDNVENTKVEGFCFNQRREAGIFKVAIEDDTNTVSLIDEDTDSQIDLYHADIPLLIKALEKAYEYVDNN